MRHISKLICLVLVMEILATGNVLSSGLRDVQDGWLLPIRETVHLLEIQPSDECSSCVNPGVWGVAGAMQLFAMPELPVMFVGLGTRLGGEDTSWAISGLWQRTGSDLFQSDLQKFSLVWEKKWSLGIWVERRAITVGSKPLSSLLGTTLLWGLPPLKVGKCLLRSKILFPLWASGNWRDHVMRQGRFRFGVTSGSYGLAGAFDKKSNSGWALGLELSKALAPGIGITLRVDPDTGALGPGALCLLGHMLLRTSHVIHPDLGITHRVTITTGSLGAVPW